MFLMELQNTINAEAPYYVIEVIKNVTNYLLIVCSIIIIFL